MPEQSPPPANSAPAGKIGPGWRDRLLSHIPPGQLLRYLFVGAFNTLFGYTTFAVINYLLHRRGIPVSYIFAAAISNVINISVAFLGYKLFVFRTKGNYLWEWLKAMAVYWSSFVPAILLLPLLVRILNWTLPPQLHAFHHNYSRSDAAPYLANALLLGVSVIYSFIAHKNITFRSGAAKQVPVPGGTKPTTR